jgi:hypothetical protein
MRFGIHIDSRICVRVSLPFISVYRSPLRSSTTASTHLSIAFSSISSHPSSLRATIGASKYIGRRLVLEWKRCKDGEDVVNGVPGATGVMGPALTGAGGTTTGRT